MNSVVTLVLLLLLVIPAIALAAITNVRMYGGAGGIGGPASQPGERVVEREVIETAVPTERLSAPVLAQASAADELAKYAALRDQGILTDEEFVVMKAAILGLSAA